MQPQLIMRRGLTTFVLMLCCGAVLTAVRPAGAGAQEAPRYGKLPILQRDWAAKGPSDPAVIREQERQRIVNERWHQVHDLLGARHLSRRGAEQLRRRGLGSALLADPAKAGTAFEGTDTLRVLIIRIAFEENREPGLTTIVPGGDFDLSVPAVNPDTLMVDPPPRSRRFFEAHLQGLSEFYRYQSGGRLHIQGRVLPEGENDSYKLSDIADYGPGREGFWTIESLEKLVRDMIVKADQETQADGSVNLADYDDNNPFTYIIFAHAGSDWQSDINQDSPNDVPTFFVTLGEPQDLIGTGSETGLPGRLSECSVIPETTNQDGEAGSIAAALYHEFGHALGLPDVYSTSTGLPSVGIWDLMDSGTNLPVQLAYINSEEDTVGVIATGVLPPSLSAWNKWFLGWLEMDEVDGRGDDHRLPAVQVPRAQYPIYNGVSGEFDLAYPQAVRGGLSPREWFLMENRWVPADPSLTPYSGLAFERDEASGVILYLAGERLGEWSNSGLYDYFMPPGGVLVWHVNMDRIEAGLPDNTINAYGDGLRLVEADGIQDIGVLDAYVLGWYGSDYDAFAEHNGFQDLYTENYPSSRNFDRSWSGLALHDVRNNGQQSDAVMRFAASLEGVAPGWPLTLAPVDSVEAAESGGAAGARGLDPATLTPVNVGDRPALIFADRAPDGWEGGPWPTGLFGLTNAGAPRWGTARPPWERFAQLSAPLAGPMVAWRNDDGTGSLLCGTVDGVVTLHDLPLSGGPRLRWSVDVGDSLAAAPLVLPYGADETARVLCVAHPATVTQLLTVDGSRVGEVTDLGPALGHLTGTPRVDGPRAVLFGDAFWATLEPNADGLTYTGTGMRTVNGTLQTAVCAGVHAFDDEGTVLGEVVLGEPLVGEPAVADLDGDGADDLILATATRILAVRPDGIGLRGFPARLFEMFPLPDTTQITGPLVVADADGDGSNEIWFGTDGGHLMSLSGTGRLRAGHPLRFGDRAAAAMAVGDDDEPGLGRRLWLATGGGYAGEPFGRQLTNGRVASMVLATPAGPGARTSEWTARAGGALRSGPVGTAADLGPAGPAAAEVGTVVLYPNPLHGSDLTVRFHSSGADAANLHVYNLEGEQVAAASIPVTAGTVNEHVISLPGIASGLYVCRLQWDGAEGRLTRTMTLAVEK